MFHYNQRKIDYIKLHKLSRLYNTHEDFHQFIKTILALPLLPAEERGLAFNQLILLPLVISPSQASRINEFKIYLSRNWIKKHHHVSFLFIHLPVNTNNGAESYHKKLKAYIKIRIQEFFPF